MNDIVFDEAARSRRGKAKVQFRLVEIELNSRGLAFSGNEVRAFQELNRFRQPQSLSVQVRRSPVVFLDRQPVNPFGQRRDHRYLFKGFAASRQRLTSATPRQ